MYLLRELCFFIVLPVAFGHQNPPAAAQAPAAPTAEKIQSDILVKMEEHNRMRDNTLKSYSCDRTYRVENKRVNKSAMINTTMVFVAPDEKLFQVNSHEGMGFMRKGVLNRMIETERETSRGEMKRKVAMSPENYAFRYLRSDSSGGRLQYVLEAKARRKDKLLFNGTIWVDAEDGAVTRIEGRPAKNPSFWTRKVDFVHEYRKIGPYWFPVRNDSVTSVFLFGRTTTSIDYTNYQVNQPELVEKAAEIRKRGDKLEVQIPKKDKETAEKP